MPLPIHQRKGFSLIRFFLVQYQDDGENALVGHWRAVVKLRSLLEIDRMEDTKELNNWWPGPISWIAAEKPLASEQVIVAEIGHPNGPHSHRHLYTALVPPKQLEKVLNHRGGIGHKVDNTSISISPKFWIWGGSEAEYLEPLVLAWEAANTTVLQLDPHFLMSYHLVPRIVPDGSVHWG